MAQEYGCKVVGVDLSKMMVERSNERAKRIRQRFSTALLLLFRPSLSCPIVNVTDDCTADPVNYH